MESFDVIHILQLISRPSYVLPEQFHQDTEPLRNVSW
jgi:hypothetical protein